MTNLTAEEKLKHLIVIKANELEESDNLSIYEDKTSEEIEELYDSLCEEGLNYDAENQIREGEFETNIPCDYSRHYENKSVGVQYIDDTWIGWTYWYGGGKHGNPEEIPWMDNVYDINCTEEEKLVIVRSFSKKE